MHYILTILLLVSCAKQKAKDTKQRSPEVAAKAELYKSLHKGWAHQGGCDSLGFTSLCKISGGCIDADIMQAESEPGRWYRNPGKRCFDDGQSKSDISKDMFVMLWPYLYATGDKQNLKEIYNYAKANGNVMGRGVLSRTLLTPPMILFLQELLGMIPFAAEKEIVKEGFEKHLDIIHIMTAGMKRGGISDSDYEILRRYVEESPRNALAQALYHKYKDGNQSDAIAILMDEKLFPSDSLPTSSEHRCEEYLWQRDDRPSDWGPCDKNKTHDGVDFLIAAWVAGQL